MPVTLCSILIKFFFLIEKDNEKDNFLIQNSQLRRHKCNSGLPLEVKGIVRKLANWIRKMKTLALYCLLESYPGKSLSYSSEIMSVLPKKHKSIQIIGCEIFHWVGMAENLIEHIKR